jgi:hypothetical protein
MYKLQTKLYTAYPMPIFAVKKEMPMLEARSLSAAHSRNLANNRSMMNPLDIIPKSDMAALNQSACILTPWM